MKIIKEHFSLKVIFHQHFSAEKREKILSKKFFFNISTQVGENLIMPSGGEYVVISRKFF